MVFFSLLGYLRTDGGVFECFLDEFHRNSQNAFVDFGFDGFDISVMNNFGCGGGYANFHVFRKILGLR